MPSSSSTPSSKSNEKKSGDAPWLLEVVYPPTKLSNTSNSKGADQANSSSNSSNSSSSSSSSSNSTSNNNNNNNNTNTNTNTNNYINSTGNTSNISSGHTNNNASNNNTNNNTNNNNNNPFGGTGTGGTNNNNQTQIGDSSRSASNDEKNRNFADKKDGSSNTAEGSSRTVEISPSKAKRPSLVPKDLEEQCKDLKNPPRVDSTSALTGCTDPSSSLDLASAPLTNTTSASPFSSHQTASVPSASNAKHGQASHDISSNGVSTTVEWMHPGSEVFVCGSYDNWTSKMPLKLNKKTGYKQAVLHLQPGVYQYKFIVDGTWKCCSFLPIARDPIGNENNSMEVSPPNSTHFAPIGTGAGLAACSANVNMCGSRHALAGSPQPPQTFDSNASTQDIDREIVRMNNMELDTKVQAISMDAKGSGEKK